MPALTKRRDGRGYEREIQALTRLRTAIVIETRLDLETHERMLLEIDALIRSLSDLIRRDLNALDSTPPPPIAGGPQTAPTPPGITKRVHVPPFGGEGGTVIERLKKPRI